MWKTAQKASMLFSIILATLGITGLWGLSSFLSLVSNISRDVKEISKHFKCDLTLQI